MAIGLVACGSAQPAQLSQTAQVTGGASELTPEADDCATKETFVAASDSALEGVIVDCATGEKISEVVMLVTGVTNPMEHGDTISDESGHYRLQLPEGRYRVSVQTLYEPGDGSNLEIEIRAQHATVKEIRLARARCPPARGGPAVAQADRAALIAAVLDHHAAAGIVDAPKRSDLGPTYVTIDGLRHSRCRRTTRDSTSSRPRTSSSAKPRRAAKRSGSSTSSASRSPRAARRCPSGATLSTPTRRAPARCAAAANPKSSAGAAAAGCSESAAAASASDQGLGLGHDEVARAVLVDVAEVERPERPRGSGRRLDAGVIVTCSSSLV